MSIKSKLITALLFISTAATPAVIKADYFYKEAIEKAIKQIKNK